jgi:hypothetical protein
VNRTTAAALLQLGALDPAQELCGHDIDSDLDLRIERILSSPRSQSMGGFEQVHKMGHRFGFGGLALSVVMAIVALLAWASPAQGVFAPHSTALDSALRAPGPSAGTVPHQVPRVTDTAPSSR